jgi:GNAT superfamily N-acetyltransferase
VSNITLRVMEPGDQSEVTDLIHISINYWYAVYGRGPLFGSTEGTRVFCDVYEDLDPGCCIIAEHPETGRLMGSCFYHPRETHVSLGIMNVHPNYFGRSVAGLLLNYVTDFAERVRKPVRLVSSAMNLESYSLYTRAGFIPRRAFQDMLLTVPESGLTVESPAPDRVREAAVGDIPRMVELENEISGILREKDYRYFIQNQQGIWHTSVLEAENGDLEGFLVSVNHPGSNLLGPGVCRTEEGTIALLHAELNANRGGTPVFLVPVDCAEVVSAMYSWGARNCELHFAQVRGRFTPFDGVVLPTFMPETG